VLTEQGALALAESVGGWLSDAEVQVSDGSQTATRPADIELVGTVVRLRAEFGEDEANFEWAVQRVVKGGVVVDETRSDLGRKAGGVMPLTIEIDVAGA